MLRPLDQNSDPPSETGDIGMNTHFSHAPSPHFNATVSAIVLLAFFLVLGGLGSVSSTAQSSPPQEQEERELEDKIPKHLPIKVKVKNLNKKDWVREVEVEVTNTGFKPIYYVGFNLLMPEVITETGSVVGVDFRYGRPEIGDFRNRPTAEDVPLLPGETCILKVPEKEMEGWEAARDRRKWKEPKKLRIKFYLLHHGDGTGYGTSGGLPVPNPNPTSSSCGGGGRQTTPTQMAASRDELKPPLAPSFQFAAALLPVRILPAKLFIDRSSGQEYAAPV
jgi:archaellum component FlaF (FlaF/FlaG flagellin family)